MKFKLWVLPIISMLFIISCARRPQLQTPIGTEIAYPQKVAVMLPLHGNLANNSHAILNGFLAAYYDYLQHEPLNVSVDIIDTSNGDIATLYNQAIEKGAIFIIGPLTKQKVNTIANTGALAVPTLALNTIDDYTKLHPKNLYQFGLSSQDEVKQIAARAWNKHPGQAVIIAPSNKWGINVITTLQNSWENYGGTIAATVSYSNINDAATQIKQALNIDASQANAKNLIKILRQQLKFNPRRRQDIDTIFLIASPDKARQIKPLLAFYYAGNIPTYSTSMIYSGFPNPSLDRDLNGIIFCDMPWILQDPFNLPTTLAALQKQSKQFWPKSYQRYARFYALGIDAYYLMLKLNALATNPNQGLAAATGTLYLNKYLHIYRQLNWAKIRNGAPQPLPS